MKYSYSNAQLQDLVDGWQQMREGYNGTLHDVAAELLESRRMSRPFERPAAERYLRVDRDLPDGGVIDLGLEAAPTDGEVTQRMLEFVVDKATDTIGDARELALRLEALLVEWWPDRYWFVEVWTTQGTIKRYQVIQPAVVGGFRR